MPASLKIWINTLQNRVFLSRARNTKENELGISPGAFDHEIT